MDAIARATDPVLSITLIGCGIIAAGCMRRASPGCKEREMVTVTPRRMVGVVTNVLPPMID
jgi:hypothetical protein